jgi:hypothetical protein
MYTFETTVCAITTGAGVIVVHRIVTSASVTIVVIADTNEFAAVMIGALCSFYEERTATTHASEQKNTKQNKFNQSTLIAVTFQTVAGKANGSVV